MTQVLSKRLNESQLVHHQNTGNLDFPNPLRNSLDSREIATDRIKFENQDSAGGNESFEDNSYAPKRHNHCLGSKLQFYNTGIVVHKRFNTSVGFYKQHQKTAVHADNMTTKNYYRVEGQIMVEDQSMPNNIRGVGLSA